MVRDVGIHPNDPFMYHCNMMSTEILKIQIVKKPYKSRNNSCHYFLVAVFDRMIAIPHGGVDSRWEILNNAGVTPSRYVDVIQDFQKRIYTVTKPHGDIYL